MIEFSKVAGGEDVRVRFSDGCRWGEFHMTPDDLSKLAALASRLALDNGPIEPTEAAHAPTTGSRPQPYYHANRRTGYCHTCGSKLPGLMTRRGGYSVDDLPRIRDHRPVVPNPAPGVYIEQSPGLMVYARIVRNGGPEDDLCDECVKIGARAIRNAMNVVLRE